jgi:signal transduction histidine kinase
MSSVPLEPATAQFSKPRILLVDDRMANLVSLQAILDEPDRELVSVSSGAEALRELEARDFALVVLDVQMPGMDGFEVAARMKGIARAQHVPIVFVTAIDHNEKHVARAYERGAVDFIQKPFEAETMRAKAAVFLDLYVTKEHLASTLKDADRLKQRFLSTLSHELRAPLTAILAWTRMVRDGSVREPQRGRALENIERNASAQLALVEGMTDISAMAAGRLILELEMVDLSSVIELAMQEVRPAAAEKKIPMHAALERDVAPVRGDARRLRQIVLQLLENAVKFTSANGGIITVSLCNVGPDVEIVVEDTGVGIEPALLPRLFAPLAWRDVGARRAEGGLGVGLTIVGHLVELHEGTIHAESAGRGRGSRFVVKLPANGPKPRETGAVV